MLYTAIKAKCDTEHAAQRALTEQMLTGLQSINGARIHMQASPAPENQRCLHYDRIIQPCWNTRLKNADVKGSRW